MKKLFILVLTLIMLLGITGCSCKHDWTEATCVHPKLCTKCYILEGESLGHRFSKATCTISATCEVCGQTEGEPLEHNFEIMNDVMTCTLCNKVDETIFKSIRGHIFDIENKESYIDILSQNNAQNNSTFLEYNGWIYGQGWNSDGESLFIMVKSDGSMWGVIDTGTPHNIREYNNEIYYVIKNGDKSGFYKMDPDGTNKRCILSAKGTMQVDSFYLYYTQDYYENEVDAQGNIIRVKPEFCHLLRCNFAGGDVTEIISKPTFHYFIFDDGILYQDDNDNSSLHICDLYGENDIKLNDAPSYWPIYDGNYIYYVKQENLDDVGIWRIKPDGSDDCMIADYAVSNGFMVTDEYIYFVYADDNDRLYRINKDGSNLTLITEDTNVFYIQLFEDKIKYTRKTDDGKYIEGNYFCDFDGSNKREFLYVKK